MRISRFIEKHFWIVLLAGIVLALWKPVPFEVPAFVPKIILWMMLFVVFLKIDALEILENIRNYRLMLYVTFVYMVAIPLVFYFLIKIFDPGMAIGILLLTAMPAGVSTPALADIVKGNIPLSMSLAIISQLAAPFTVPLLFWLVAGSAVPVNKMLLLKDIAILVFSPMIIAQIIKRYFSPTIQKIRHLFTSANVFLLFVFVYITLSTQRDLILDDPFDLIWETGLLYLVFIILHVIGYFIAFKEKKENRISIAIGAAYTNNGLAIVLAVSYFRPEILVLMVLSEIPWSTLPALFRKLITHL
jgi:BASS family bile acid:Na+ symporter